MNNEKRLGAFCLTMLMVFWATACGSGGGGTTTTTTPPAKTTPTVTVTPGSNSIPTTQALTVTVAVNGSSGTPTGSVTLSSGSYTSAATSLSSGSATISIAAGSLASGTETLTAIYTPDANSSSNYNSSSGTSQVTVSKATPTVATLPALASVTTTQSLSVTVSVGGGAGAPTATGTVTLSYGATYTSAATALSSGSAQIVVPAGKLPAGTPTVTATYTPDAAGSALYNSAQGSATVTVNLSLPAVTVTPGSSSIVSNQSLSVTVAVSGGATQTPTGSVTLTSGSFSSGAVTLTASATIGSATITIPANSLTTGNLTLTATYTPDLASSPIYTAATGQGSVTVTAPALITPTVTVSPGSTSITNTQSLTVTLTVSGGNGKPTPTGSVTLTSGSYSSSAATLSGGSAQIVVPAGSLASGLDTLTVTYTPDAASSGTYTSASGTATETVGTSVTVNQSSFGPALTNQILGMNMAVWYDFTANTTAIVNALQGAGFVSLRWPGGSTSDDYHWNGTSASNPANGVAPTPSTCAGAYQDSTTNYLSFIKNLEFPNPALPALPNGFDVALTADYGTNPACTGGGSASEAANWVQYAYANGGTVSHVTVGNEEYGSWEEDLHAVRHDPSTYAAAVSGAGGYYKSIKAANSSTLVGVIVDANCTTANGCTDNWDSTVLSNDAGYYDFVEYHYYPQNPGNESDTFLVQQAAQGFTTNINTIKSELASAGETNTPIYVGELGSVSSDPGKQSMSITQGLYAGQMLGEMMNDGVARATWWIGFGNCNGAAGNLSNSLYGWQGFGAYNVFSDGPAADPSCAPWGPIGTLSPTTIAFQLFNYVVGNGGKALNATVAGDTSDVRAYAAAIPSGTALVLFNRNQTTAQKVVVSLSNESNSPGVTEYTYDKEMYDYTNTSCQADPTCTYDPTHNYSTAQWVGPATTNLGATALPLTLTLQPWSMNVFIVQ